MSRSSILAIGIAAVLMVCALGGAIAVMNSDSNDSQSNNISTRSSDRSYSSGSSGSFESKNRSSAAIAVELPSTSDAFNSLLEERNFTSDTELVKVLDGMTFMNGKNVRTVTDADSLAEYLSTIGYRFIGQSLVDDGFNRIDSMEIYEEGMMMLTESELKSKNANFKLTLSQSRQHISPFTDVGEVSVGNFLGCEWAREYLSVNAIYAYINENGIYYDVSLLTMLEGTPFYDAISGEARTIEDADDLAMYMYTNGYTVIGNSLVFTGNGDFSAVIVKGYIDKLAIEKAIAEGNIDACAIMAVCDSYTDIYFLDLGTAYIYEFIDNYYIDNLVASIMDDMTFGHILGQYIQYSDPMYNVEKKELGEFFNKAMLDEEGNMQEVFVEKADAIVTPVTAFCGTLFVNADGEVECVTDAVSMSDYLSSVGLTAYDGNVYFFYYVDDVMAYQSLSDIEFETLYYIVTGNGPYQSYAVDFSDMEKKEAAAC